VHQTSGSNLEVKRLIKIPALVTLAVTLMRLGGELLHGPRLLFNSASGGAGALVGIVWLAPIFGVYFALKLVTAGHGPESPRRAVGLVFLGIAVVFVFSFAGSRLHLQQHFRERLIYLCMVVVAAALVAAPGWLALFRTLLAYAYAARIPVAILAFFALWRDWGTHYDALPPDLPEGMSLLAKYAWLGLLPQLIFWVATTILAGMLFGSLAAAIARAARHS